MSKTTQTPVDISVCTDVFLKPFGSDLASSTPHDLQNKQLYLLNLFFYFFTVVKVFLEMIGRVGTGVEQKTVSVPNSSLHGTDFRLLLESLEAGMSFSELDDRGRAHSLGLLQGMILARTAKLSGWDLESSMKSFDL